MTIDLGAWSMGIVYRQSWGGGERGEFDGGGFRGTLIFENASRVPVEPDLRMRLVTRNMFGDERTFAASIERAEDFAGNRESAFAPINPGQSRYYRFSVPGLSTGYERSYRGLVRVRSAEQEMDIPLFVTSDLMAK